MCGLTLTNNAVGAISVTSGTYQAYVGIRDSTISSNQATSTNQIQGGALGLSSLSVVKLQSVTISSNSAVYGGLPCVYTRACRSVLPRLLIFIAFTAGGINATKSFLFLSSVTGNLNTSSQNGGFLVATGSSQVQISQSTISNNSAGSSSMGGGIYAEGDGTTVTVSSTAILNNASMQVLYLSVSLQARYSFYCH